MDEGKSPYFVTPEGKKLYCKLRGRVSVIAENAIAVPQRATRLSMVPYWPPMSRIFPSQRPIKARRSSKEQRRKS